MDSKLHFNDIIRFCDHKNMGIDPNLTHVGALVFVLQQFPHFRIMADRKRPSGGGIMIFFQNF